MENFFTDVGAMTAVIATALKEISGKGRENDTGPVSLGLQNGQYKLNDFLEDPKWGGGNFPPQMELPITFKRQRCCPVILLETNGTVSKDVKDEGNIALGFVTHNV
jgi:hypothetical protein